MTWRSGVVDAHLHVWRLPRGPGDSPYRWLTPDLGPLYADVDAGRAGRELAAHGVHRAVLVQADDTLEDTAAMLAAADAHGFVEGVVGWLPLDDPPAAARTLARWRAHPAFCGVRHLVHDDPRADFLDRADVRESLGLLAAEGLPLDVPDAFPRHLHQVARLVEDLPGLTVVVDHLAKPPLADGPGSAAFRRWEAGLRSVAASPRAVAKVSGLRSADAGHDLAGLRPALDVAVDAFEPGRLMYGGDWPMTLALGGYGPGLAVVREWAEELDPAEADAFWGGTAERVYGLAPSWAPLS